MALAPAADPLGDPGADPFSMFGQMGDKMPLLLLLVFAAVLVAWLAGRQYRRSRKSSSGRRKTVRRDTDLRQMVVRLEGSAATPIASAKRGPVRVRVKLESASGNLGGAPGRECVWRNRVGAPTDAAVGAELVVVTDASGRAGLVELEKARVVAPTEKPARDRESMSLYLGDEVEVFANFEPAEGGDGQDTTGRIYGTLGADARLEVRLVERRSVPSGAPAPAEPTATTETP